MNEPIETGDYWIVNKYLIFKPEFNDSLDKYANLLNKYTWLIFSNYDDWKICFETNNKYTYKYDNQYIYSKFNQPIKLNQNITHLTMGEPFNKPIELNKKNCYIVKQIFNINNEYKLNIYEGVFE